MKIFITALFLLITANLFSQSNYQYWQWAKSYGGQGDDITSDIKVKNGSVYITGTFTSPSINWENTILINKGNRDIFIAKLDTNGNTIWAKNFGGSGDDSVRQLEINNNGDFVLLCKSSSNSINFGSVQLNSPNNFYAKFDSSGNLLQSHGLPDSLTYNDIDIDNNGGVYIACNYYQQFTFANTLVTTVEPATAPVGAPVVYINGQYHYSNPQDVVYYTSGSALLKYDSLGGESWIKAFHAIPQNLFIAFDSINNTIVTLFHRRSAVDLDGVWYSYYSTLFESASLFLAGISPVGQVQYANSTIAAASFVIDFEIDNHGLGFLSYSTHTYGYIYYPTALSTFRNGQIRKTISTASNLGLPYSFSTLKVGENGHTILNDYSINNYIHILDSNLLASDSIIVPDGGHLTLQDRVMTNKALYFADHFNANSLVLPDNSGPSLPPYNLQGQGGNDIFIGKFHTRGYLTLSFKAFQDTFKFCDGMTAVDLDSSAIIKSAGAGNLSYHWKPAINFTNPNSLSTSVIMSTDTLYASLTIIDAAGDSIANNFLFYNGLQSDLHLKLSDTSVCAGTFIDITLTGSIFADSYAQDFCPPYYKYSFDSLQQTVHAYSGNCTGLNYFRLVSASNKYCIDTTPVKLENNPGYSIYRSVSLCAGSDYIFPNDTTITNITQNYRRVRYFKTSKGCDSTLITDLFVITFAPQLTEDTSICAGSNFTFPDGTMQNNIQADVSHQSILKAIGGCDSLYINTNLTVKHSYNSTYNVIACAGSSYTFPDSSVINNIQADLTHISHFAASNNCDSLVITNLSVTNIDTSVTKTGATLRANISNANYQWLDCVSNKPIISETAQTFTSTLIGNFAVEVKKDGCTDTSSCYSTSYEELINIHNTDLNIYPVPASDILTIKFISEVQGSLTISLHNELGKSVILKKINLIPGLNQVTLNIASLQRGVYTLSLLSSHKQRKIVRKIIVD